MSAGVPCGPVLPSGHHWVGEHPAAPLVAVLLRAATEGFRHQRGQKAGERRRSACNRFNGLPWSSLFL
ncbi:MAG: hypothetical protein CMM01_04715 [Rhodopirellula sp.]|nr:hypothetical protein [Rhodopirellula sp.]